MKLVLETLDELVKKRNVYRTIIFSIDTDNGSFFSPPGTEIKIQLLGGKAYMLRFHKYGNNEKTRRVQCLIANYVF